MRFLLRLVANAAALAVATWLLAGIQLTAAGTGDKVLVLLVVALIFGIVNAIVKPIFTARHGLLVLLTLGLFLLVINALMLLLTSWLAGRIGVGWYVDGFWTALLGSIIVSVVSFVLNAFLPDRNSRARGARVTLTARGRRAGPGRLRLLGQHLPLADGRAGRGAVRRRRRADRRGVHQRGDQQRGDRGADRPPGRRVLAAHGYRADDHSAHQITPDEIGDADLVMAAETLHVDRMLRDGAGRRPPDLLSDYDPDAGGLRATRPLVRRGRGLRGDARRRRGGDARRARGGAAPPALIGAAARPTGVAG